MSVALKTNSDGGSVIYFRVQSLEAYSTGKHRDPIRTRGPGLVA